MFPIFVENSRLPVWLSKIVPINVYAFSFAIWVVCRGTMSERTKRHEIIHYKQQLEMLFVLQWALYGIFHLINLVRYRDGQIAYYENPFEREAYDNDEDVDYLEKRKHFAWVKYIFKKGKRSS
tara:strand:- start:15 stop:383 length:369 start_codon:yes stop_codon:yes gene_type:complete